MVSFMEPYRVLHEKLHVITQTIRYTSRFVLNTTLSKHKGAQEVIHLLQTLYGASRKRLNGSRAW
jgi:hypothetical protein